MFMKKQMKKCSDHVLQEADRRGKHIVIMFMKKQIRDGGRVKIMFMKTQIRDEGSDHVHEADQR